jgi:DNA-binding NtrC family response regulator
MSTHMIKEAAKRLALRRIGFGELTIDEVVPHLVGHTVKEVERELIIHTLARHHGSRTISCRTLGISIRCIRNKIHEYEELGIAVPEPGEPSDLRHQ